MKRVDFMNFDKCFSDAEVMVSVICATYNHAPFLHKALDGFLMQKTNFRFEVIIHDDASTDGTTDVVRKYAEQYPDIIIPIYEEENQYSQHIDFGKKMYDKVKGKYIAYCEGDDYWIDKHKLQKQFDYMESHPDCSICSHNSYFLDDRERDHPVFKETVGPDYDQEILCMEDFLANCARQNVVGGLAAIFMRKKCVANYPWLRRFSFGDLFMILSPLTCGYLYYTKETMAIYRVNNPGSYNGRINSLNFDEQLKKRIDYFYELIEALEYFNVETQYKWDKEIQVTKNVYKYERIGPLFFELILLDKSVGEVLIRSMEKKIKVLHIVIRIFEIYKETGVRGVLKKIKDKMTGMTDS